MSTDIPKSSGNFNDKSRPASPLQAGSQGATSAQGGESEDLRERAREVQGRIEEGFHEMEQRYGDAREQMRDYNDKAVEFIRQNPAMCLAGAVGVGFVLGKLASRRWLR